jgi:ferredoxin
VCPSGIFSQEEGEIRLNKVENCIGCGHCMAACANAPAITHSLFPPEKVHSFDRQLLPSPEQLMLLCKARRSNRAFSKKPIPAEMLEMIVEAAHRAPTASNMQQVEYTLITNPKKLNDVIDATVGIFSGLVTKLSNPLIKPVIKAFMPDIHKQIPRFKKMQEARMSGGDPVLRGFTTLLLIHTPSSSRFGCQDANLAYQNGSLMAETIGVSQFYTGFLCTATKLDKNRKIESIAKIKGTIHAGMALAMPAFEYQNYIDRKKIKITRL